MAHGAASAPRDALRDGVIDPRTDLLHAAEGRSRSSAGE